MIGVLKALIFLGMPDTVQRQLASLSVQEIADAVAPLAGMRSKVLRAFASTLARGPSQRLARALARFDRSIGDLGLPRAARSVLGNLGARVTVDGSCPPTGPALVVANHPGAYDALAIMAGLLREDVAILAADRAFLRAMPNLRRHLIFVATTGAIQRAVGLRSALEWLERGGALLQFGAGAIEPDGRFVGRDEQVLREWGEGTGLLARQALRASAKIVPCFVSGVHSPRAKQLSIVRWAERRGITTIAPLIQATVPGFRDVIVSVKMGAPLLPDHLRMAKSARDHVSVLKDAVSRLHFGP